MASTTAMSKARYAKVLISNEERTEMSCGENLQELRRHSLEANERKRSMGAEDIEWLEAEHVRRIFATIVA